MITLIIVIVTSLISVLAFRQKELFYRLDLSPTRIVHKQQYYRIFTHAFVHADYFHLGYSSYMSKRNSDNINHSAHFWGAVVGFIFPLLLEPRLISVFFENPFPN